MTNSRLLLALFACALVVNSYAQTTQQTAQIERVSKKMSALLSTIGPGTNDVNMDWSSNTEVAEIAAYPTNKRIAAINTIIWGLQENDEKIFKKLATSSDQVAAAIITRIHAYTFLRTLTGSTTEEIGMKDLLDGEIADLRLAISGKIQYQQYFQSKKQRAEKLTYLYMPDKAFVEEMLRLKVEKNVAVARLTTKTSAVATFQMCVQNLALCEKF